MVERSLSLVSDRQILTLVLDPLGHRSLLGGFLSETYLGRPEPQRFELTTQSLSKYKCTIDRWGGWMLFQVSIIPNRVTQGFEKLSWQVLFCFSHHFVDTSLGQAMSYSDLVFDSCGIQELLLCA
jgi:hypothetical protein